MHKFVKSRSDKNNNVFKNKYLKFCQAKAFRIYFFIVSANKYIRKAFRITTFEKLLLNKMLNICFYLLLYFMASFSII